MTRKLLSIVVPTKNRYYYLKYLIQLIEMLQSDDIELVIQDNSDDNEEFQSYLKEKHFDFIRYDYVSGQIPMSDNSDRAILNSTGEYVCFLGDDDGITRYLLEGVRWMKENSIEAVKPAEVTYSWPDAPQGKSAEISYYPFTGKVRFVSAYEELLKVLQSGIQNRGNMPLAYHAVVSRSVLDKVYAIAGSFFPGNSPDISNAVSLSLVVKKFALVDIPWAYSGNSAYKGGGVFARGNSAPGINEIPWFRPNPSKRWSKRVPMIASGANIWADSAIETLKNMKREDLIDEINFYKLYANFIFSMPSEAGLAYSICPNRRYLKIYANYVKIRRYMDALCRRIGWTLNIIKVARVERNIQTIIESSKKLEELSDGIRRL